MTVPFRMWLACVRRQIKQQTHLLVPLVWLIYLTIPVEGWGVFHGRPFGLLQTAALATACWIWSTRRSLRLTSLVGVALVAKLVLGTTLLAPRGFEAAYHANADLSGPVERSTESGDRLITRIDPRLEFDGSSLPLYFFNDAKRFNFYLPAQPDRTTLPFSVIWQGVLDVRQAGVQRFYVRSPGGSVQLDIGDALSIRIPPSTARWVGEAPLVRGFHRIRIALAAGQGASRSFSAGVLAGDQERPFDAGTVFRRAVSPAKLVVDRAIGVISIFIDLILCGWLTLALAAGLRDAWVRLRHGFRPRDAITLMWVLAIADALVFALPVLGHMTTLSGGNDWLSYETLARDIGLNGLLMSNGAAPKVGRPFYFQPLYPYFLAACHWLFGEGLSGVYFVQRLLVWATVVTLWRTTARLFGERTGFVGLVTAAVVVYAKFASLAGVLLSEALFVPLVCAWAFALVRLAHTAEPSRRQVIATGIAGGVATLTRSTLLLGWIAVLPALAAALWRTRRRWSTLALVASAMCLVVSLATMRNWIVAREFVPINNSGSLNLSIGNQPTFKLAPTPPGRMATYTRLRLDANTQDVAEYACQAPGMFLDGIRRKALFTLGWFESLVPGAGRSDLYIGEWAAAVVSVGLLLAGLVPSAVSLTVAALPLLLALSYFAAVVIIFPNGYGDRFIFPFYALLVPYVAMALAAAYRFVRSVGALLIPYVAVALAAAYRLARSVGARATASQTLPLAAILLLAVELRLIFTAGMVQLDSLRYVHLARNLADGVPVGTAESTWVTARIGLYGPVAVLYALFGVSDITTLAWPFGCSLFGVVCAYGIGRVLDGEAAGLLAAFLWAVLPTNVVAATALLGDGPIAALSMGVVFFVLVAKSARGFKLAAAITASLTCLLVGILNKLLMVLVVVFLAVYMLWTRPKKRVVWLWVTAIVGIAVAGSAYYFWKLGITSRWSGAALMVQNLAGTATDWWSQVVTRNLEFSWISPLWIVAASALMTLRRRQAYVPLLWFGSMFLYLELGSRSLLDYSPMVPDPSWAARHFLLVAAPAMIATGMFLALELKHTTARGLTLLVSAVIGVIAFVGSRHATYLGWGITGEAEIDLPFAVISALATACVIFGGIASPAFLTGALTKWRSAMVALLLVAIGVAALNPSYRAASVHRNPWVTTLNEAVSFLDRSPSLPVLVQSEAFGERLDYTSGFRLGFNSTHRNVGPRARIDLAPQDPNSVRDAYVLIDEFVLNTKSEWRGGPDYLRSPPPKWAEVAQFGDRDGYRLRIYRVSSADALKQLQDARSAVHASRSTQTLRQLLAAATGAGEYCEAASAWQALRLADAARLKNFDPLPLIQECSGRPDVKGPNLFQNAAFAQGMAGWAVNPDADATVSIDAGSNGTRVWHVNYRKGNWSVIYQGLSLQPDTVYVWEAEAKTTAPVVSLYWQAEIGRFFEQTNTYRDWTALRYVFITPHWDGRPYHTGFSPVLMKGPGEAWLKNLRLSEFRAPAVQ